MVYMAGIVGVLACASSPGGGSVEAKPVSTAVSAEGSIGRMRVETDDSPTTRTIPLSLASAWAALPTVYSSLGLSITQVDTTSLIVRGVRARSRQPFVGKQLSELLDCGETAGIPNTMRYDVTMQVATQLRPDSSGTAVVTQVLATAKASGTAGDPVRCGSNGRIATGIADALRGAVK